MVTKEQDLKRRLGLVLQELHTEGGQNPEHVLLIGSLAATLIDTARAKSWPALKDGLSAPDYDKLLNDFQVQGNALHQSGDSKKAYAIQALGISLVCRTQRADEHMREGEDMLDAMITGAVKAFRRTQRRN